MTATISRLNLGNQHIRTVEGREALVSYNGPNVRVHGEVIEAFDDTYLVRMNYGAIFAYYVRLGHALPCTAAASARWEAAARRRGLIN